MKTEENTDRRIRRTKRTLMQALVEILKNKNVENVTVSELANKADITRTTFYQYYRNPIDMLEKLQDEIALEIQEIVEKTEGGDSRRFFYLMFNYFYQDKIKADILGCRIFDKTGCDRIGYYIHNKYVLRWKEKVPENNLKLYEYYRYYIIFGCISVLENWVYGGMKETPEEMAEMLVGFLPREKMYLK